MVYACMRGNSSKNGTHVRNLLAIVYYTVKSYIDPKSQYQVKGSRVPMGREVILLLLLISISRGKLKICMGSNFECFSEV